MACGRRSTGTEATRPGCNRCGVASICPTTSVVCGAARGPRVPSEEPRRIPTADPPPRSPGFGTPHRCCRPAGSEHRVLGTVFTLERVERRRRQLRVPRLRLLQSGHRRITADPADPAIPLQYLRGQNRRSLPVDHHGSFALQPKVWHVGRNQEHRRLVGRSRPGVELLLRRCPHAVNQGRLRTETNRKTASTGAETSAATRLPRESTEPFRSNRSVSTTGTPGFPPGAGGQDEIVGGWLVRSGTHQGNARPIAHSRFRHAGHGAASSGGLPVNLVRIAWITITSANSTENGAAGSAAASRPAG